MPSIAQEFRKLIEADGIYVAHIERRPDSPCPICIGKEADAGCTVCLGLGSRPTITPRLVRLSGTFRPNYNEQTATPIGVFGAQDRTFYCLPETPIHDNDLLALVAWSAPRERVLTHGRVLAVHYLYTVESPVPYYGERGELAYFRLGVHDVDVIPSVIVTALKARPTE